MIRFVAYDLPAQCGCSVSSVEVHSGAAHALFESEDWGFEPTARTAQSKRSEDVALSVHSDGVLYLRTTRRDGLVFNVAIDFRPSDRDPLHCGAYAAWTRDGLGRTRAFSGQYANHFGEVINKLSYVPLTGLERLLELLQLVLHLGRGRVLLDGISLRAAADLVPDAQQVHGQPRGRLLGLGQEKECGAADVDVGVGVGLLHHYGQVGQDDVEHHKDEGPQGIELRPLLGLVQARQHRDAGARGNHLARPAQSAQARDLARAQGDPDAVDREPQGGVDPVGARAHDH